MNSRALLSLTSGLCVLAFLPARSFAQTVDLQLLGYAPTFGTGYDGTIMIGSTTSQTTELATLQNFAATNWQPALVGSPSTLDLFCVEFGQNSNFNPQTYQILSAASADTSPAAGSLETAAGIGAGGIGSTRATNLERLYGYEFSGGYNPMSLDYDHRAGFQLAVWKLSHSDNFNHIEINDPSFSVSGYNSNAVSIADGLLDIVGSSASIQLMDLTALHSDTYQDFLAPTMTLVPVPEPSTYAAVLGLATLGVALIRRRSSAV